jgi:hypothetical protein
VRVTFSSTCTRSEYGDPFSVLGTSRNERQFHGYQKGRVGWLPAGSSVDVTASGTYTLSSVSERPGTGPQVLRVLRPKAKRNDPDSYYYVELRTASGTFDGATFWDDLLNVPAVDGVYVRIAPDYWRNAVSDLLDMAPGTPEFTDAALREGQTFTDPTGITIRLTTRDGATAVLDVGLPAPTTSTKGPKGSR